MDFVTEIRDGLFDDELTSIERVIQSRRQVLAGAIMDKFQPGDRVIFNGSTRPLRHVGDHAEVIGPAPKKTRNQRDKILVKIDGQDRPMAVPPQILTKIGD